MVELIMAPLGFGLYIWAIVGICVRGRAWLAIGAAMFFFGFILPLIIAMLWPNESGFVVVAVFIWALPAIASVTYLFVCPRRMFYFYLFSWAAWILWRIWPIWGEHFALPAASV